jgi:hypothetical protein
MEIGLLLLRLTAGLTIAAHGAQKLFGWFGGPGLDATGLSAGPPGPAEILPGTAIRVALGIQDLRTRVFRGVELKDHPLRIRNARIRRRVQKPDVFVRELKVYGTDVIFQLLRPSGQRRSRC